MDGINLAILVGGFLFVISIIATLISARLGAPMLLVFLIIGMLAGEEGIGWIVINHKARMVDTCDESCDALG